MSIAYLDHNATAPLRPSVRDAMLAALDEAGNPSSVHRPGRKARGLVEAARVRLAAHLGVKPQEIVFTSGGTEANNLALEGVVRAGRADGVIVSGGEHDSVLAVARDLGVPVETAPLLPSGLVDAEALAALLARWHTEQRRPLVSLMLANNETGVVQPIAQFAALVHEAGGLLHTDAVQMLGKRAWRAGDLDADLITLSAHKCGGPKGVGALVVREGLALTARQRGGGQELGRRSGTENVAAIAGFGALIETLDAHTDETGRIESLRDHMEQRLRAAAPDITIFGMDAPRLANTSAFAVHGLSAETQVMALDLAGVAVSAGSACSSGKVTPSHVLQAMGADVALTGAAIRVSLGWTTSETDIDRLVSAWTDHRNRMSARRKAG